MRTTPQTKQMILDCLRHNAANTKTRAMRRFAAKRLEDYERAISVTARSFNNPMERFCGKGEV